MNTPTKAKTKKNIPSSRTRRKSNIPLPEHGPKWAAPLGLVVLLLAIFGLVSIVSTVVNNINTSNQKEYAESVEYYEHFLTPIVMLEPQSFESIEQADKLYLVKLSIMSILFDESIELPYDANGLMMISSDLVEAKYRQLFGNDLSAEHKSFFLEAILFRFNKTDNSYHIPATGLNGKYKPKIVDIFKKRGEVWVKVDLLETETDTSHAEKSMYYIFTGRQGENYIKRIEFIE